MDTEDCRPHGPYDTEADARTGAAQLLAAFEQAGSGGDTSDAARQARREAAAGYLTGALGKAGVALGAFDARVADSLTMSEPETLAVLVGWIERAHADGCAEAEVNVAPGETASSTGDAPAALEAEFPDPEG